MRLWHMTALVALAACAGSEDAVIDAVDAAAVDTGPGTEDAAPSLDATGDASGDASADTASENADIAEDALSDAPDSSLGDAPEWVDTGETADSGTTDAATEDTIPGDAGPLDPATVPLRGPCLQEERIGGFLVEVQELFSIVDGKVANGVDPNTVQEVVKTEGGCTLLRTEYPSCDPLCDPGFTCAKNLGCVPYPLQQDVGTVTIEGLEKLVVMEPKPPSNSYFDTQLPQPAFLPGVALHLTSTAGWAGELELFAVGSAPMEIVNPAWVVKDGEPLSFTWDPPPEGARTLVEVRVTLDQHGNTPVSLICDLPDTGAAQIPAPLIAELLSYGISGYPNARVSRRTVDSVSIPQGCIDFVAGAPRSPTVTVSGHYPCSKPDDCPPGLSCNLPIETCE